MDAWKNTSLSFEERAKDLVSRMSLEEKAEQLRFNAPANPRLGIPAYSWWNECLHGVARAGIATVFPQAIGMAASFNAPLLNEVACAISDEARAKYSEAIAHDDHGIYKGLTMWSPNINIFRDPRWGRGHETYGEDPYLTGRLGVSFIKGLQGDDSKYFKVIATAKHYAVHSGPEELRHEFDAIACKKDMFETYLPAFEDAVKEAGVYSVMGAYNRTNGELCCASPTLLGEILRDMWGFDGYVVSDCGAVEDFHMHHKVTADEAESAAAALNNGCDLCCGSAFDGIIEAHKRGILSEETISTACYRLMLARMRLGMFDPDEIVPYASIPFEKADCEEHHELNREMTRQSLVLLKNDGILPLDMTKYKTVAVIGPNAHDRVAIRGNYEGTPSIDYTVLDGIRALMPDKKIYYSQGNDAELDVRELMWGRKTDALISEAKTMAERSDIVILVLGLNAKIEGEEVEGGDKKTIEYPQNQQILLDAVLETGKPVVLVNISGSAVDFRRANTGCRAIVHAWYPGQYGGLAIAELLTGRFSPSARLPVTVYTDMSQLPDFKDYSMDGRTYKFLNEKPMFPFGYGLSYTNFEYSGLNLSSEEVKTGENVTVSVTVKNTGKMDGREVVQLYIKDMEASSRTPLRSLIGFENVLIKAGEAKTVTFTVTPKQMAVVDADGRRFVEPGLFTLYAGGGQPDARSEELTGQKCLSITFNTIGERIEVK